MIFVELIGLFYQNDEDARLVEMGVKDDDIEDCQQLPCTINVNNIELMNPSHDGRYTTIQFRSGERFSFAHTYGDAKTIIYRKIRQDEHLRETSI